MTLRLCPSCALVSLPRDVFCPACSEETRPMEAAVPVNVPISASRIPEALPGAPALLVALVAFAIAAMSLRTCEVDGLEDEHAAPACVGRCG